MEGVGQAWTGLAASYNPGSTVMDALQPAGNFCDPFFVGLVPEHGLVRR